MFGLFSALGLFHAVLNRGGSTGVPPYNILLPPQICIWQCCLLKEASINTLSLATINTEYKF